MTEHKIPTNDLLKIVSSFKQGYEEMMQVFMREKALSDEFRFRRILQSKIEYINNHIGKIDDRIILETICQSMNKDIELKSWRAP